MKIGFLSKTEINISYLTEGLLPHPVTACRSRKELLEAAPSLDVLVVQNQGFPPGIVDEQCLRAAQGLRLVQHHGVASDATDIDAAARLKIPVAVIPGQNSRSVAEHAFYLTLALARKAAEAQRLVLQGRMGEVECVELAGKTLCVVGVGTVGKMLARMAKGFDMTVVGVRRTTASRDALEAGFDAVHPVRDLHRALAAAEFVILALPLHRESANLIDASAFAAMRNGAVLVNVSRGAHVDRGALQHALAGNKIAGFATDAYWEEPADPRDSLLRDARVLVTPHMAGKSVEAIRRSVAAVRQNIERLAAGQALLNIVNAHREAS